MVAVYATFLSICAILLSLFLHGAKRKIAWIRNAHIIWLIIPTILFITKSFGLTLLANFLLIIYLSHHQRKSFIAPLYIAALPALPVDISFDIPFPGLQHLLEVNLPVVWSLVLCPYLFKYAQRIIRSLNSIDFSIILYAFVLSVLSLRNNSFTNTLRILFQNFLIVLVPYFVISRSARDYKSFANLLNSLGSLSIIFCSIGIFSILKQWNFYEIYNQAAFADFRYGFLRIEGTVATGLFGFICGLGFLLLIINFFSKYTIKSIITCGGQLLSLLMTFSRGSWLACLMLWLLYYIFSKKLQRFTLMLLISFTFSILLFVFFFSSVGTSFDIFGTFSFRQSLYNAAIEQFYRSPLIGDANYIESPSIRELPHGLGGIIDIVSGYLEVLLEYGLVGLILYLVPFILLIFQLIKYHNKQIKSSLLRRNIAFLISSLIAYLIFIATISFVSLVYHFGWILIALSQSFIFALKEEMNKQKLALAYL